MRIFIYIFFPFLLAFIYNLAENGVPLPVEEALKVSSAPTLPANIASPNLPAPKPKAGESHQVASDLGDLIWNSLNRVILPFFLGWGLMRVVMPFRWLIAIIAGVVAIVMFIFNQIGFIELTLHWAKINTFYENAKQVILDFGLIQFIAFAFGIGAGIAGFRSTERQGNFALKNLVQK
jgi:uncharacterized membrane protein (Fun14 family)